jgi:hypothetical protein
MKKKLLVFITLLLVTGCVQGRYDVKNKELEYTRFLTDQEVHGFEMVMEDGSYITFDKQKSDMAIMKQIVDQIMKLVPTE